MNIAIIGAGGSVGRTIAQLIVAERLLQCDERLMLVGNPKGESAKSLYGLAVDLMDAYAENYPQIDIVFEAKEVRGDLIIMAGGATIPAKSGTDHISRDFLAEQNLPIFEQYASELAKNGHRSEIVICISNPNELAVAIFAKHLGRKRVIGIGAFLDSLRFRKEIALDLGIRRQLIHGFMVGEHGENIVPLWSSIHIYGFKEDNLQRAIKKIRRGHSTVNFLQDVKQTSIKLKELVNEHKIQEAYTLIDKYPPDIRVALKPFVTHFSGSKTVVGTARTSLELIRTITLGNDALISGQIKLEGDFYGIHSTIGVPFVVGNQGVDRIIEIPLTDDEKELLCRCAENVNKKILALIS
jgi:malate dehydrogenase